MAVRKGALDVEGVVEAGDGGAALEQHAQALDERRGPFGEVGQGAFVDLAGVAEELAQEHGGGELRLGTLSMYMATECERQRSNESI